MLLEAMGLHVPGAAFVHPHDGLREALTREAVDTVLAIGARGRFTPIGRLVEERVIVNAMVALLATGGSTNHLIHWVAVARAAGITIDWTDFADLSAVVPLLARVYPNGEADVNEFQAAGGPGGCTPTWRPWPRAASPPMAPSPDWWPTVRRLPGRQRPSPGIRSPPPAPIPACCVRRRRRSPRLAG